MRVSELARRAGVAPSSVRWYERVGVLPTAARRINGYRQFDEIDVARLRLVVTLRRLGLAPDEAGRLAQLCLAGADGSLGLTPILARQRAAIALQRRDLDRLEGELLDLELTIEAADRANQRSALMSEPAGAPIRVLFVCTHNSARSQIAEALLARYGGADFEVASAGTEVRGVNPYAVRVLAENGIDWSRARSKLVDEFLDRQFDYVITVCDRARETCPVFPGSENTLHWGLDDPSDVDGMEEERLAAFRSTLLEVTARLRPFIEVALRAAGRTRRALVTGA